MSSNSKVGGPSAQDSGSAAIEMPDTRTPEFRAEARRQAALVAASAQEADDQAFTDSISIPIDELDGSA